MLARLKAMGRRSRNADGYELVYTAFQDVFRSLRFIGSDEKDLVAYLKWLQVYRIAHKIKDDEDPTKILDDLNQYSRRILLSPRYWVSLSKNRVRQIHKDATSWFQRRFRRQIDLARRYALACRNFVRGNIQNIRAFFSRLRRGVRQAFIRALSVSIEWVRWPFAFTASQLISKIRVRHLYTYSRKTAYDLLTKHGDLPGAIDAFDRLTKIRSHPDASNAQLDSLMARLLPIVRNVEDGIRRDVQIRQGPGRLVISMAVWGDQYLDLFTRYCLPSLLAPGNLEDLDRENVYWHVFTTASGKQRLSEGADGNLLHKLGRVRFEVIPDELIDLASADGKYWLYGALTQTSFRLAARLDADVHFMNPDTVYSAGFFAGVKQAVNENEAKLVLSNSFRTTRETILGALDAVRTDAGAISLSADRLHSFGLQHLHPVMKASFLSPKQMRNSMLPRITVLGWRDGHELVLHTAHYTPIFVSREALDLEMRLSYFTIDSTILRQWSRSSERDKAVYVIDSSDGVGYFEISARAAFSADPVGRSRFIRDFWETNGLDEYELFRRELRLPLSPGGEDSKNLSTDVDGCRYEFDRLMSELIGSRPVPKDAQSDEGRKWFSVIDLVQRSDLIFGAEINSGCGSHIDEQVERLRSIIAKKRTVYSDSPMEKSYLGRMTINFLRLGLLDELIALRDEHNIPLDGDASAFIDFCQDAYLDCAARGAADRSKDNEGERFVLGSIVWGREYIENFMNINVRSMLAPGNLPAVAKEGRIIHAILTNAEGEALIRSHPVFGHLESVVDVEFFVVPDELIRTLVADHLKGQFYLYYGMLDHCLIHYAQGAAAHLFMIPVDAVVADGSLSNMAAYRHRGFECCGGGNIVAETDTFVRALHERYDGSPDIAISTYDLASLAVEHAHHYFRSQVVALENQDFGIHAREIFWPTARESIEIHSVFIHPLFTTASALERYKRKHYANIDYGLIPRIFESADKIKIIEDPREAYINNFAQADRLFETSGESFELEVFLRAHDYSYPVQKALFTRAQRLPCHTENWTPYRDVGDDVSEIALEFGLLSSSETETKQSDNDVAAAAS